MTIDATVDQTLRTMSRSALISLAVRLYRTRRRRSLAMIGAEFRRRAQSGAEIVLTLPA
jgi:hypothetical protein